MTARIARFADGASVLPMARNVSTVAWGFADGQCGTTGVPGGIASTVTLTAAALQSAATGSMRVASVAAFASAGLSLAATSAAIVSGTAAFTARVGWAAVAQVGVASAAAFALGGLAFASRARSYGDVRGKYRAEHDSALASLGAAQGFKGFASEHASALASLRGAGV